MGALPVPASLLAQFLPPSTTAGASRFTAEGAPHAAGTAAAAWQFPELLAGMVSAFDAVAGDGSRSEAAPPTAADTLAGIETLLGGTHTPQHSNLAAASRPAAARTKPQPDTEPVAGRSISAATPQPVPAAPAAGGNLPAPEETVSRSAANEEATVVPGAQPQAAAEKAPTIELQAPLELPMPGVTPAARNPQAGQTATAAGRNPVGATGSVPSSGGDGQSPRPSAAPTPQQPASPAIVAGEPVPAAEANPAEAGLAPDAEPADAARPAHAARRQAAETATLAVAAPASGAVANGGSASRHQPVGGAPRSGAELAAAAAGTLVAGSGSESPVPSPGKGAARPQDGRYAPPLKKTQTAATATRSELASSYGQSQGQAAQGPSLAPGPAGIDANPEAGAAGTPVPRTAGVESVLPLPAAGTAAEAVPAQAAPATAQPEPAIVQAALATVQPEAATAQAAVATVQSVPATAQSALATAQPAFATAQPALATAQSAPGQPAATTAQAGTPPARRRREDSDLAVAAGETVVRSAMPALIWRPSANPDPTDVPVRPSGGTQTSTPSRRSSAAAVAQVLALSGQAPRTVDSIPSAEPSRQPVERAPGPWSNPQPSAAAEPEAPVTATAESGAGTPVAGADAQVRVLDTDSADRDEVAFAVQMNAAPEDGRRESPARLPEAEGARWISMPAPAHDVAAPEPPAAGENHPSVSREADEAPAHAGKERRPEPGPAERTETPAGALDGKLMAHVSADPEVKAESAPDRTDTAAAGPVRPQDAMESATGPEAAKAPLVRDMKLEVTGGEQRVEIRVSERGGEVKMTVRTPDTQLAGTLRENLPTLSARLADSGFKSDAWHPAASATNQWRHTGESSAGGASQDANTPSRQQNRQSQDDAGQRRPQNSQEATPQQEKGKDFAWLMSTLR